MDKNIGPKLEHNIFENMLDLYQELVNVDKTLGILASDLPQLKNHPEYIKQRQALSELFLMLNSK